MGNIRKRKISISIFYLTYFVALSFGVLVIIGGAVLAFNVLVASGQIYPANYAEIQAKDAADQLGRISQIQEDMIPDLCQYIVFSLHGNARSGNISSREEKAAWEAVEEYKSNIGIKMDTKGNYYMIIPREGEYLVLRYQIIPQYRSAVLRRYLLPPQNLIITGMLLLILLCVACTAFCFGRALKKRLSPLLVATEKIQEQELEFTVGNSNIKEIDTILASMEKMRAALQESLEKQWQQEQARREQIAALAHDLKTPLTLVRGNVELLGDTKLDTEQMECVEYIENSTLQMQEYVQMMIEISSSGTVSVLKKQRIALDSFLEKVKPQCKGLCVSKKLQLQWSDQCGGKVILMDSSLFARALLNVLSNAVEYTPESGSIFFEVAERNEGITFVISDTGGGFSPEALKHATEQFFMGDQSRSGKMHFGMGLAIAKSIVEQHGGILLLENTQDGGAKVMIQLFPNVPPGS